MYVNQHFIEHFAFVGGGQSSQVSRIWREAPAFDWHLRKHSPPGTNLPHFGEAVKWRI